MGIIRECCRDSRVPDGVGVLVTSRGAFFVVHEPTALCPTPEPHHADACGEFLPVRPGFEPDVDGPDKPIRWMYERDWREVFAAIDHGARVFPIIDRLATEVAA